MPSDDDDDEKRTPEIFPPGDKEESPDGGRPAIYAEIVAQFNKYTDRPDLFLETIEKADPGFIKKMNVEAERFSRKNRDARFRFGGIQAYTALVVSALAAIGCLGATFYLIATQQAGFWTFVGMALLYAVTQGGSGGFASLISSVKDAIQRYTSKNPDNDS